MRPYLDDGDVVLYAGDCVEVMRGLPEASVDAVVTDPPYGLGFMGQAWDTPGSAARGRKSAETLAATPYGRARAEIGTSAGYGAEATSSRAFGAWCETWATEALRVLKPGGHLLAFGGTRTYHRLACAIEDAGFEVRDALVYMYGSGFPKSLNPGCRCEAESPTEHDLYGLPGAHVPASGGTRGGQGALLLAGLSEPGASANGAAHGDGPRGAAQPGVARGRDAQAGEGELRGSSARPGASVGAPDGEDGRLYPRAPARDGDVDGPTPEPGGGRPSPGPRPVEQRPVEPGTVADERGAQAGRGWPVCPRCGLPIGLGTALKPGHEPIVMARKPLAERTVAGQVLATGTGALNIDGCRIGTYGGLTRHTSSAGENRDRWEGNRATGEVTVNGGRWPANVVLDEAAAALLDAEVGERPSGQMRAGTRPKGSRTTYGQDAANGYATSSDTYGDTGGPSRFFYTAKASGDEREGSKHPTVKPLALMRWLVRLVTPPGGVVLDPFTGSGTTLRAAREEGFRAIGIEREAEYLADAAHRLRQLSLFS